MDTKALQIEDTLARTDLEDRDSSVNSHYEANEHVLASDLHINEKKLMRKIDWRVLPILCGFYLLQAIDKGNIGLAKLGGIQQATHTQGSLFNWAVAIFYLGYVLAELPCNLILQRVNPRYWLAFATLAVCRFFLGVFEAGILPASVLITALWYKRSEHATKTGIWFSFSSLGSAVGGIMSYGIQGNLANAGGREGWQWLMIIEGAATIAWAIFAFLVYPNVPEKARFLNEDERTFVLNRQRLDHTQNTLKFDMAQFWEAVKDYKTWVLFCIYFIWQAVNIAFSTFSPSIIVGLGFSNLNAQLLSAPFNLFNLFLQIVLSVISDRLKDRSALLITCGLLSTVGYISIVAIHNNNHLLYGLLFFTSFNSGSLTLILGWMTNIIIGNTKRTVSSSIIIIGSSLGAFAGSQVYQDSDAPRYIRGHTTNLCLMAIGIILVLILRLLLMKENRRRDKIAREQVEAGLTKEVEVIKDVTTLVNQNFTDKSDMRVRYYL
ncbi:hypothetical protein BZG36_03067 [Bifiguratus adelaidae]|uniref:Major facilitator superfamily (MFS) profile domain-containing protein n=1 Tax=Bifiguratus adelaidae TaxID=1938954 RepID=A0A261XZF4_9FUNG|nr:hypothetical protein BZG36_03067 [Bifiguratus adelaidae]